MDVNEIVALAKAGFTADQIAKMNTIKPQPTPEPTPIPPVPPVPPVPKTELEPPTPPTPPQSDMDKLMAQMQQLAMAVQSNAIANSNLPQATENVDDILASIIEPVVKPDIKK